MIARLILVGLLAAIPLPAAAHLACQDYAAFLRLHLDDWYRWDSKPVRSLGVIEVWRSRAGGWRRNELGVLVAVRGGRQLACILDGDGSRITRIAPGGSRWLPEPPSDHPVAPGGSRQCPATPGEVK